MNKAQAIHQFWSMFLTAYDENTVPTGADAPKFPYITYSLSEDNLDNNVIMHASLWYRSPSWSEIEAKVAEIAATISRREPIPIDGGYVWIKRGSPFAQRGKDQNDDMIRTIHINITTEYLTEI